MAGKLLVPVTAGYDVFDPQTGAGESHIQLSRPPSPAPWCPRSRVHAARAAGRNLVALGAC